MTLTRFVGSLAAAMLVAASASCGGEGRERRRHARSRPPSNMPAPRSRSSGRRACSRSIRSILGSKVEALTGIKIKVIEVPTAEMFTKILQELSRRHRRL